MLLKGGVFLSSLGPAAISQENHFVSRIQGVSGHDGCNLPFWIQLALCYSPGQISW